MKYAIKIPKGVQPFFIVLDDGRRHRAIGGSSFVTSLESVVTVVQALCPSARVQPVVSTPATRPAIKEDTKPSKLVAATHEAVEKKDKKKARDKKKVEEV